MRCCHVGRPHFFIFIFMELLLTYLSSKIHISDALHDRISHDFERIETHKGDILLQEDRRADYLYFIEKGVLHNFYYHEHREVTSWFYTENQFITAWSSFYTQTSSFEAIRCLEDCVLYRISYDNYQRLITEFPAFGNFARILAEEILILLDVFSKSWAFMTAKEKYDLLQQYFPEIELRVKLGLIASFLGISQETLSRIRASK